MLCVIVTSLSIVSIVIFGCGDDSEKKERRRVSNSDVAYINATGVACGGGGGGGCGGGGGRGS